MSAAIKLVSGFCNVGAHTQCNSKDFLVVHLDERNIGIAGMREICGINIEGNCECSCHLRSTTAPPG